MLIDTSLYTHIYTHTHIHTQGLPSRPPPIHGLPFLPSPTHTHTLPSPHLTHTPPQACCGGGRPLNPYLHNNSPPPLPPKLNHCLLMHLQYQAYPPKGRPKGSQFGDASKGGNSHLLTRLPPVAPSQPPNQQAVGSWLTHCAPQ